MGGGKRLQPSSLGDEQVASAQGQEASAGKVPFVPPGLTLPERVVGWVMGGFLLIVCSPLALVFVLGEQRELRGLRGCVLALAGLLLCGAVGFALMGLLLWPLAAALRGLLPEDVFPFVVVIPSLLLWPLLSFLAELPLIFILEYRKKAKRRQFEARAPLSDEDFARLFPGRCPKAVAAVREELMRVVGRPEIALRLLPADNVLTTCSIAGADKIDELELFEALDRLEKQFGCRFQTKPVDTFSVADLVAGCSR